MKASNIVGLARFLAVQRVRGFDVPTAPVFDPETQRVFSAMIETSRLYVEYGTGGSTVVASAAGLECLSVESDPFFANAVRNAVGNGGKTTVLTRSIGLNGPWGMPIFPKPTSRRLKLRERYAKAPLEYLGNRVPDFTLIDGRLRLACALVIAKHAMDQHARTAMLVDDYAKSGRHTYATIERFLGPPRRQGRSALFNVDPESTKLKVEQQDIQMALSSLE